MRSGGRRASYVWGAVELAWLAGIFGWAYASGDTDIILPLLMLTAGLSQLIRLGLTTERLSRGERARSSLSGAACIVLAFSVLVQHQSLARFGMVLTLLAFVASLFARRVLDGRWRWSEGPSASGLARQSRS
jgi:multisubunit Na+/H+ antiporter MnhF subunit